MGKARALFVAASTAVSRSEDLSDGDPREFARTVPLDGFSAGQSSCLDSRYVSESSWRIGADNPASSASGIRALTQPQALRADYMTSAESQIRWGLECIQDTYGTLYSAWSFRGRPRLVLNGLRQAQLSSPSRSS